MTQAAARLRCFHHWTSADDPRELLDPSNQFSTPWGESEPGPCDKCTGSGQASYACRSCIEAGTDPDCVACGGRVRFLARCPTCEGSGEITNTRRAGISVFPSQAGLLRYLVERGAPLDEGVIVELDGEPSEDLDLDADAGALLVRPTEIVAAHRIEPDLVADIRERLHATSDG